MAEREATKTTTDDPEFIHIPIDAVLLQRPNAVMMIYKVLRPAEWAVLWAKGRTAGAPVDLADGFVHFSTAAQLPGTLTRHFSDAENLTLLACDSDAMGDSLRWEPSRGGDLFPHLYRPLCMTDIRWNRPVAKGENGHETGPLE